MIFSLIARYAIPGLLSALVAALGALWWQSSTLARLEADNAALRLVVDGCEARVRNILEGEGARREAESIDPTDIPSRWLRPDP